jgi:hypothetical protein
MFADRRSHAVAQLDKAIRAGESDKGRPVNLPPLGETAFILPIVLEVIEVMRR